MINYVICERDIVPISDLILPVLQFLCPTLKESMASRAFIEGAKNCFAIMHVKRTA